jgi:CO dehydrogenase nickel-insertion accessory protein CooC1
MFIVDQQKLLTRLRIREADPARIFAVDYPANSALSRKLGVREREKVSEIVGRQPEDTKGHGVGP